MLEVALGLTVVALGLLYYYLTSTFSHWKDKGVPFIKPYPLVGSLSIRQKAHATSFFQQLFKNFDSEPFIGFFLGRTPALILRDPGVIKNILLKDFNHFYNRGIRPGTATDPLQAKGLNNLEDQQWKDMRTKLTPTFTSGRIKAMFPLVQECAESLEKHLGTLADAGEEFDIKDLMARYSTDAIGSYAFGVDIDSINNPNCKFSEVGRKNSKQTTRQSINRRVATASPTIAKLFKLQVGSDEVTEFFRSLVRDVMAVRAKTGETRKDFMQLLIELKDKGRLSPEEGEVDQDAHVGMHVHASNEKRLTLDDVAGQALTFFNAGFEPSSTALTFALYELSRQPELQRRARREIEEVLQRHGGQMSYQALQEMTYVESIIQESLRMYPPIHITTRVCNKKYLIPGTNVTVEKGTRVMIPIFALQRDPKCFPDPEIFDPERFNEEGKKKIDQYMYIPFGVGPRGCIGLRFSRMQTVLGLASVLRRFELRPSADVEYPVTLDPSQMFLVPKQTITVRATRV